MPKKEGEDMDSSDKQKIVARVKNPAACCGVLYSWCFGARQCAGSEQMESPGSTIVFRLYPGKTARGGVNK